MIKNRKEDEAAWVKGAPPSDPHSKIYMTFSSCLLRDTFTYMQAMSAA